MSTINFNQCNFRIGNIISAPFKPVGHYIEEEISLLNSLAPEIQELYRLMPDREYGEIHIVGDGILQFSSTEHYENVIDILEEDCDRWDGLFSDKYAYMDFEQMDDFCDKINYNQFLPILLFEEKIGILGKTLFDTQSIAMQKWMDGDLAGTSPRDNIFILESEQAVHSTSREVCIKDTIYQFREDSYIEIPLSEVNTWMLHRFDKIDDLESLSFVKVNIIIKATPSSAIRPIPFAKLEGQFAHSDNSIIATDEKVVWEYVGRVPTPWNQMQIPKIIGKITCYKKNKKGKFKKHQRKCAVAPIITFYLKDNVGDTYSEYAQGPFELFDNERKRWDRTEVRKGTHNYLQGHTYENAVYKNGQIDKNGNQTVERIAARLSGVEVSHTF